MTPGVRTVAVALASFVLAVAGGTAPATAHGPVDGYGQDYHLDDDRDGAPEHAFPFGRHDDEVVFGDWDGNGTDTPAARRGSTFFFRGSNTAGPAEATSTYGRAGDEVFVGDWDGDGADGLGVRRGNVFYLANGTSGGADVVVEYGWPDDEAYVGDWDGDGRDTLAIRRGGRIHVTNDLRASERTFAFGWAWDVLVVGDWDGDGRDGVGVRRDNATFLRDAPTSGPADSTHTFGRPSDSVAVGDWDGDGRDSIGVRRPPEHPLWLTGRVTDLSGVVPYSGRYDPRNGHLAPSQLCLVPFMPSHYVHCRSLPDLEAFHRAYSGRFGQRLPVDTWDRSTYRTFEQQEQTWEEIGPPIAARPGTSPHGWGLAVDMFEGPAFDFGSTRYRWMLENGPRFGWANLPWHRETGSVPEYWHFDHTR